MLARVTAALCGLVLLAAVATVSYDLGVTTAPVTASVEASDSSDLDFLEEIISALDDDAVEAPEDEELVKGAVDGLFKALDDPYARYYDKDAFADLNAMLDGGFSGIGVVLEEKPKGLIIVNVFEGTPAAKADMRKGERITSVDGTPVESRPVDVIINMIKGDEGTEVTLGLAGGPQGTRTVTLTRARIELPNIESRQLADGAGYVKMTQFTSGVGDEIRAEVTSLVEAGARGVVLDLRGNPGGLLNEAVEVSSVFIEDGDVVSVKERGQPERSLTAEGDAIEGLPVVVLVDKGSASASEIVAGALQDADRATIVGEPTFGKGTVQTIHRLQTGGGVKYTTAEYFTPSGDSIEDVGVKPDRLVKGEKAQLAAAREELSALIAGDAGDTG